MKRELPYRPFIAAPEVIADSTEPPAAVAVLSIPDLCGLAGVPLRVTSPHMPRVVLHRGTVHYRGDAALYVGIGRPRFSKRAQDAMRVLEVLAHGFHDYASRESICGRGFFTAPKSRGRPPIGGRRMTAAERMRRMRARRA